MISACSALQGQSMEAARRRRFIARILMRFTASVLG
ncbi:hypothetical protein NC652_009430 [Populus alba x Populus x berolinensis]|nr:hypothetical protein NC652_009430 [Populus alba x Populus x berolinensis]